MSFYNLYIFVYVYVKELFMKINYRLLFFLKVTFVLVLLCNTATTKAITIEINVNDTIKTAVVWSGDVSLNDTLVVSETGSLTIEPGTSITLNPGSGITLIGKATLKCSGTETDSIHFITENFSTQFIELVNCRYFTTETEFRYCSFKGLINIY